MSLGAGRSDGTAQRLAALSPEQRALLEIRLKQAGLALPEVDGIPRRMPGVAAPLSFAQERLWFLEQLEPGTYNVPQNLRLTGPLQLEALRESFGHIVRRHEVFRTSFPAPNGHPQQMIVSDLDVPLPITDLGALPQGERELAARRLMREQARRPFDLERGPLFRISVLRITPQEHILLLCLHHIICDAWSMEVIVRELGELYQTLARGDRPVLPELPIQYSDYAHWQRRRLDGEVLEDQLAYWRKQLAGAPTTLALPTDYPRPAVRSYRGAKQSVDLSASLTARLRALAQGEGATLFMAVLAAFQALLARYTGQEDIVVGSPMSGRSRVETEGLVGLFLNTLAFRTDCSGNPTYRQLLSRVREVALAAYSHQELPFEKLVEALRPERSLTQTPLFQVMFVMHGKPRTRPLRSIVKLRSPGAGTGTAKFDLTLSGQETASGLRLSMRYTTDLFEAATIAGMLGHFQKLLEGIVENPDRPLSDLPLLSDEERDLLLVSWNATATDVPRNQSVHRLFEEQAARTPQAVAVAAGDEQLSYRELDRRANQLARYLRARGVGPDIRVGVCVDRSLNLMIALLGVLKAGGAYVALDPAYPEERLRFLLRDAQMPVLLTDNRTQAVLPIGEAATVVNLDRERRSLAREPDQPVASGIAAEHLAYVIYTSGSTGIPKGVAITHGNAVAFLTWARQTTSAAAGARVLATTSINFDLSVYEIFGTLSWGGTVLLAGSALELQERPDLRVQGAATLLNTVPSAAAALVRLGAVPAGLVRINLAGEPLPRDLVEKLYAHGAEVVYNLYGPSETTTYSTAACIAQGGSVPPEIGRFIANTRGYVLDPQLAPVPIGVPGELYLGGSGVARGYLGKPALTAERFVPDPFGPSAGAEVGGRLYRTGDRVRWRPNGTLEYLGRMDHQLKLRGFRIEPGEIEVVLGQHPAVQTAVVSPREDASGEVRLVAYVVPERPVDANELRRFLGQRLPEYMVPTAIVPLESLPLLPNGKLDRAALPPPDQSRSDLDENYNAPHTAVERMLADAWTEVLGVHRVGVHDNFFELGGHSLLATRVMARVQAAAGVELPVRVLFEEPTVEGMARRIEAIHQMVEEIASMGADEIQAQASTKSVGE
jgi:amino acid adenylation domain-containing protein